MSRDELRLVIEQVALARPAIHEQLNHTGGLRHEVRSGECGMRKGYLLIVMWALCQVAWQEAKRVKAT